MLKSPGVWARQLAIVLVALGALTSGAALFFWQLFERDVPATIGNLRGTALTMLVVALPTLATAVYLAGRGSVRAIHVWLGCLAYVAYNAVMFAFAAHFNALFPLFVALLAVTFWALVMRFRALDIAMMERTAAAVPVRPIAVYLAVCAIAFAALWLSAIVPSVLHNTMPRVIVDAGVAQNTVWVLDFAFTFPLMITGAVLTWRRRGWGYVLAGMMLVMLTIETAGIAVDQIFGHLHDPSASLGAVPAMIALTIAGLAFCVTMLGAVTNDS